MGSIADLYASVRADMSQFDSDLSKGLTKSADRSAKTFGDRFRAKLSASNIGAGIGAALGGIGAAALRMGAAYDDAMDTIRVGTGVTGDALAGLEADFKAVAARVPDDLGLIGQVIADLNTRTGQTGEGLQTLAEQILDLSRITKTDASANVAALTRLYGDWSIATEDQAAANDKLFRTSQATGIGVTELTEKVVAFGAPMRALGLSFEESIAILGKWEKEGVNIDTILAGMRMAVANFAKAGIDPREGLPALISEIEGLDDAHGLLAAKQVVGQRAANDFFRAVKEGRFDTEELMAVIENGSDTISAATQDTEGLGEAWRQFKNIVATTVGPITKDLGGIATEMGNLIFLLPALGGLLGKGLGALWTKAGGSAAVRAAVALAGTTAGLIYHGAAFVISKFTTAVLAIWAAAGGPRVIAAATAAGAKAGIAYAGAAGAGGLVGGLVKAVALLGPLSIPVALAVVAVNTDTAKNQAKLEDAARVDRSNPEKDVLADLNQGLANAGVPLGIFGVHPQDRQDAQETGRILGTEAAAAFYDPLSSISVRAGSAGAQTAEAFADGFTGEGASISDAFGTVADGIRDFASVAVARALRQMERLATGMATVAARGVKGLRSQEKDADEAWKNILGAGDANKKRLREVEQDIAKWERRMARAIRNNDSEAYAYAVAQRERLEEERGQRQVVVNAVNKQHKALDALPEQTTTTVNVEGEASLDRVITKIKGLTSGEAVVRIDGQVFGGIGGRASGGPVYAHTPYVVGERGPEVIIPRTSGTVIANDRIGGDTYEIAPQIYGLPMQARTPLEVVQQLRRAVRMGMVAPRKSERRFST